MPRFAAAVDAKNKLGVSQRKKIPCYLKARPITPATTKWSEKHPASRIALRSYRRGHPDLCISYILFYGYSPAHSLCKSKPSYFDPFLGFPVGLSFRPRSRSLKPAFSQFVSHMRKGKMLTVITVGCSRPRNRFKSLISSATSMSACKPSPVSRESSFSPASGAT